MLTFEKDPFQGTQSILEKLTVGGPHLWRPLNVEQERMLTRSAQNLPFQKVQHRVDTTDAQPSNETGGILVMVTGALMVRGHPHS